MCSPAHFGSAPSPDLSNVATSSWSPSKSEQLTAETGPAPPQDFSGFPTYSQYEFIEAAHLAQLSSTSRQDRALIPQALFDRIWDVLTISDFPESPQFRFWVRKTFTLGPSPSAPEGSSEVALLHRATGLLVAVREQLYQLLCYFHGETQHCGRDTTTKLIYEHYRYVPKKLVQEFVKVCPTCASK
ncbi:hypothetical protein FB451DRAFT_1039226, partial [Mycena latifolia]